MRLSLKELGMYIKLMRKSVGIKQHELANELGLSSYYLSRIENGIEMPEWISMDGLIEKTRKIVRRKLLEQRGFVFEKREDGYYVIERHPNSAHTTERKVRPQIEG